MSKLQRLILAAGSGLALAVVLFPPARIVAPATGQTLGEVAFVWVGSEYRMGWETSTAVLAVRLVAVLAVTAAASVAARVRE